MGVTVIGGLITSTLLTLVFVPLLYSLMEGFITRTTGLLPSVAGHERDAG